MFLDETTTTHHIHIQTHTRTNVQKLILEGDDWVDVPGVTHVLSCGRGPVVGVTEWVDPVLVKMWFVSPLLADTYLNLREDSVYLTKSSGVPEGVSQCPDTFQV